MGQELSHGLVQVEHCNLHKPVMILEQEMGCERGALVWHCGLAVHVLSLQ